MAVTATPSRLHSDGAAEPASSIPPLPVTPFIVRSAEPINMTGDVIKRGWMWKRSGRFANRSFDRRFVVLGQGLLKYSHKETDKKPQNTIAVTEMLSVKLTAKTDSKHQYGLELETTEKIFHLFCDDKLDLLEWVRCISAMISDSAARSSRSGDEDSAGPSKRGVVRMRELKISRSWLDYYMHVSPKSIEFFEVRYCPW